MRLCRLDQSQRAKKHNDDGEFQHYVCSNCCGWPSTQPHSGAADAPGRSSGAVGNLAEGAFISHSPAHPTGCNAGVDGDNAFIH